MARSILFVLAGLFFAATVKAATYVETEADFAKHIELHRQRVAALGLALAAKEYPSVDQRTLRFFLLLHDSSKTKSTADLYRFYGKTGLTEQEIGDLKKTVQHINDVDSRMAEKFFRRFKINAQEAEVFLWIEKVADLVDRSSDPVATEEFARKMTPASEYMKDERSRSAALFLEKRYNGIVSGFEMPSVRSCQRVF
ncbi:hypothetical protein [Bdellovibrio bacteriovorus]|uniref:hypothetical protein n=1 Tax=Bdellovibrio bacteriovorus TaxID=959 RepID=UPI0035A948E1